MKRGLRFKGRPNIVPAAPNSLYMYGTFYNGTHGTGLTTAYFPTPTLVDTDVKRIITHVECTFYLKYDGTLYAAGYRENCGLGPPFTYTTSWVVLGTGVNDIYNIDSVSGGGAIYRKGTSYYHVGTLDCDIHNGTTKTNAAPTPRIIPTLGGLDIVSITGDSTLMAITSTGDVYINDGLNGDTGGMRWTDWNALTYYDDGKFHQAFTGNAWNRNSVMLPFFQAASLLVRATPNSTLYVSGSKANDFPGYPVPAFDAVATRPTAVGGVWGTIANTIPNTANQLRHIACNNYQYGYAAGGNLYAGWGDQTPTVVIPSTANDSITGIIPIQTQGYSTTVAVKYHTDTNTSDIIGIGSANFSTLPLHTFLHSTIPGQIIAASTVEPPYVDTDNLWYNTDPTTSDFAFIVA